MKKKDFYKAISEKTGLPQVAVRDMAGALAQAVEEEVRNFGRSVVPGLGIFKTVKRAARTGVNPHTGEPIQIPEKTVVKFKAAFTV